MKKIYIASLHKLFSLSLCKTMEGILPLVTSFVKAERHGPTSMVDNIE